MQLLMKKLTHSDLLSSPSLHSDSQLFLWIHSETFIEYLSGWGMGYKKPKETIACPQGAFHVHVHTLILFSTSHCSLMSQFEAAYSLIPTFYLFPITNNCWPLPGPVIHWYHHLFTLPHHLHILSQLKFQSQSLWPLSLIDSQLHHPCPPHSVILIWENTKP